MKFIAAFVLSLFVFNSQAQVFQVFKLKPHQKQWEQGPLSWTDFQGTPPASATQNSELHYQLIYELGKIKSADSTFYMNQVFGYIDQKLSWAIVKTPAQLNFNQAKFNLLEFHRRQLQHNLNGPLSGRDAHLLAGKVLFSLKNSISNLEQKSDKGRDSLFVTAFLDSTNQVLSVTESMPKPAFELGAFGIGTHLGFGYQNYTGALGRHFTNAEGIEYNLSLMFKKAFLNLDFGIGFSEIERTFAERPDWEPGKKMSMLQAGISYGYTVLDKRKFRLTPFGGIAALGIQPREYYFHGINNTSAWYGGLQIDYKFKKRIWMISSFLNPKEIADFGIRAQIRFMPVQYNSSLKGNVIGLTLAPYIVTKRIKNRKLY